MIRFQNQPAKMAAFCNLFNMAASGGLVASVANRTWQFNASSTLSVSDMAASSSAPLSHLNQLSAQGSSSLRSNRSLHVSGVLFPCRSLHRGGRSWKITKAVLVSPGAGDVSHSQTVTANVPVLSVSEVMERLKISQEKRKSKQNFLAMYSSIVGGITTDPGSMVIPMDDHMVHRGHGVFDTAAIMDGHLYELDQHLNRFLRSASMAKIALPFDQPTIRSILIETVSASKCRQGSLRYWLSAGPGDFLLSPSGCHNPALYAIVIQDQSLPEWKGVKVTTSSIPIKSPKFAVMKTVNYLPNVLSKMEAEENGAFAAIWLDDEGFIAEGPNMNVGFVTLDNVLRMPHFEKILSGCTAKRVLLLAQQLVNEGRLSGIKMGNVTVEEGKMSKEMMLIGSGILVKPVVKWDDQIIGDGKEGPLAKVLFDLLLEDMKSGPSSVRVPVPY